MNPAFIKENPIDLNADVVGSRMYITQYTIRGAPTTGGVPDSPIYLLDFPDMTATHFNSWVHANGRRGFPLQLDGDYTSVRLTPPMHVMHTESRTNDVINLQKFRVSISDMNGNPALFTGGITLALMISN